MRKCEYCNSYIPDNEYVCSSCGAKSEPVKEEKKEETVVEAVRTEVQNISSEVKKKASDKSVSNAFVLFLITITLGYFGIHRFVQKKYFTGFLWLITGGLFIVGYLIDSFINFIKLLRSLTTRKE